MTQASTTLSLTSTLLSLTLTILNLTPNSYVLLSEIEADP